MVVFLWLPAVAGAQNAAKQPPSGEATVQIQLPPGADVKELLNYYEQFTGKRVIYDNQVQGPIPLVINRPVAKEEAIKIIETALLVNGFTLVPTEDPRILKLAGVGKNPRTLGVPLYTDATELPRGEQVVTYLLKLTYADPARLRARCTRSSNFS